MLQGQATGKVGDIVFMVRNGQQISRVYTSAGGRSGDQASIASRRQRVRFGAASNQYLLYRNIVRGMYRTGKATKQSDYNFFVKENIDLLPYLTKEENAAGVKCAMPGTFSRGTLGSLNIQIGTESFDGGNSEYQVSASGQTATDTLNWDDTVADLKDMLKSLFPNARKVNYCLCWIIKSELDTPSGTAYAHTFERGDVVFDLYEEDSNVADSATIAQYFAYYGPQSVASELFGLVEGRMMVNNILFAYPGLDAAISILAGQLYTLIFATNDQVGDCYTTTLSSMTVPESAGGLSLYDSLRTDDHRQVAEDSYGYSTGVMRTNIQQA